MESFEEFVTDKMIIECVCRKRAAQAAKRHKAHHNHAISLDFEIPEITHVVYSITPPRREWIQLGKGGRLTDGDCDSKQTISTVERTFKSCLWTIERDKKNNEDKPYLKELALFIEGIRNRIKDPDYKIKRPKTFPVFKKKKTDGIDEYRPICLFTDLYDAIIIILANRYLSRLFDEYFYEDSLAFRPKRLFHGEKITTSHHDAVSLILDYLKHVGKRKIYVAECDMQKFYDTVDHGVVRSEYYHLIDLAHKANPGISFDAINRIFDAYLKSYNFAENVYRKNSDKNFWKKFGLISEKSSFGWVREYQIGVEKNGTRMTYVGVPQGGALSGLIANIVLNRVDDKLKCKMASGNDLYIRYCDDMLLLSTNCKRCNQLFKLYSKGVEEANLIPHSAEAIRYGTSGYWDSKTKSVYQWIMDNRSLGSRWIGFVGYEISRSGEVRVRKSSLKKEKRKQKKVVSELFRITYRKRRVGNHSMENSYRGTMMSMAVGRATLWNFTKLKNEFCWINGFKKLNDNRYVKTQVRDLDRCRNRIIHKANLRLNRLMSIVGGEIPKEGNNKKKKKKRLIGKSPCEIC